MKMIYPFTTFLSAFLLVTLIASTHAENINKNTENNFSLDWIMKSGIACESYIDGVFHSISSVTIDSDNEVIEQIGFTNVGDPSTVYPYTRKYQIDSIDRIDENKIILKGKNDAGYDFIASLSILNKRIDFNILIEGRGRVEVKNIGTNGLAFKKKFLDKVWLGY